MAPWVIGVVRCSFPMYTVWMACGGQCTCSVFIVVCLLVASFDITVFSRPEFKAYFEQECPPFFLPGSKVHRRYRFTFGPSLYWSVSGSYLVCGMKTMLTGHLTSPTLELQTLPHSSCICSPSPYHCFVWDRSLSCSSDNTVGEECGNRWHVPLAYTSGGWRTWRCGSWWPRVSAVAFQVLTLLSVSWGAVPCSQCCVWSWWCLLLIGDHTLCSDARPHSASVMYAW